MCCPPRPKGLLLTASCSQGELHLCTAKGSGLTLVVWQARQVRHNCFDCQICRGCEVEGCSVPVVRRPVTRPATVRGTLRPTLRIPPALPLALPPSPPLFCGGVGAPRSKLQSIGGKIEHQTIILWQERMDIVAIRYVQICANPYRHSD